MQHLCKRLELYFTLDDLHDLFFCFCFFTCIFCNNKKKSFQFSCTFQLILRFISQINVKVFFLFSLSLCKFCTVHNFSCAKVSSLVSLKAVLQPLFWWQPDHPLYVSVGNYPGTLLDTLGLPEKCYWSWTSFILKIKVHYVKHHVLSGKWSLWISCHAHHSIPCKSKEFNEGGVRVLPHMWACLFLWGKIWSWLNNFFQ